MISTELQERGCSEDLFRQLDSTKVGQANVHDACILGGPHASSADVSVSTSSPPTRQAEATPQASAVQQQPIGLRQELQSLVDSAQRVAGQWPSALVTEATSPTAPPSPHTLPAGSSREELAPPGQRQRKHEGQSQVHSDKYQPYDMQMPGGQGDAADAGAGSAEADEESESEGDDDELVDDAPKGRIITPLEAALAAYRQQKRQINKVGIAV